LQDWTIGQNCNKYALQHFLKCKCLLNSLQALKFTSRDNSKKKSSGADDAESDDDSEDEDTALPDADSSAANDARDTSLPGTEKPKTEIAGLASLRSLFEGTQNDPPMPVDYLRGVNSKCACSRSLSRYHL
jgi:hypothetical protein